MARSACNEEWIVPLAVVSAAYIAAFALTFGLIMPAQTALMPEVANFASIMFLPHGVRVLVAWMYGWRALVLLAPSALLTHAYLFGVAGFAPSYFIAALFGVFCASFSFWSLAKLGMDFRLGTARLASWREILLAGYFASVINVVGTSGFFGSDARTASAYFVGDLVGLVVAMFVLMVAFRAMRNKA